MDETKEIQRILAEATAVVSILLLFKKSRFKVVFDSERGAFTIDGQAISPKSMRKLVTDLERIGGKRAIKHLEDYFNGRITSEEWRRRMTSTVRAVHLLNAALALGSLEAAKADQEVQDRINKELLFIFGFTLALAAGKVSEARAKSRAKSYFLAASVTFFLMLHRVKQRLTKGKVDPGTKTKTGIMTPRFTEAIRRRTASESCPGCIEYANRWLPIAEMPPIGTLDCGSHCRCYIEYR